MRTKKVNRYYCDHCNKGSCGKASMVKHESRCIKNPKRHCGFCAIAQLGQKSIDELVKLVVEESDPLAALKVATDNCPACILAAIVQAKPRPDCDAEWIDFNYKESVKAFWEAHTEHLQTYASV